MSDTDKEYFLIGKSQGYALLVDNNGNPILDANGKEQTLELRVTENGLKVDINDAAAGIITAIENIEISGGSGSGGGGGEGGATETTLAAILAKIIAAPATEAKQNTGNTSLATIAGKDFATQATLASILTQLNTTGLKKIIDALPAGTNLLGKVGIDQTAGQNTVTLANVDIALSALRDAIVKTGETSKTLADLAVLIGTLADSAVVDPAESGSEIALLKGIIKQLQGDGTVGKSTPVSITASPIAVPVDIQFSSLTTANPIYISDVGNQVKVTATITRPANTTAYTANKVVGATTYSSISTGLITGSGFNIGAVTLEVDADSAVTMPTEGFRLHLYNSAPVAIADGANFNVPSGDRTKYLGFIPLVTPIVLGATQWSQNNVNFRGKLGSSSATIYFYLETLGAWTPTSGLVIKPVLHIKEA